MVTPVHQVTVTRCCAPVGRGSTVGSPREQFDSNGQYFKLDANTNSQVGALKWGALGLYCESPELPGASQSHCVTEQRFHRTICVGKNPATAVLI